MVTIAQAKSSHTNNAGNSRTFKEISDKMCRDFIPDNQTFLFIEISLKTRQSEISIYNQRRK
jgi:hypothetical protein